MTGKLIDKNIFEKEIGKNGNRFVRKEEQKKVKEWKKTEDENIVHKHHVK